MHRRASSKVGADALRLDIPKSPSGYGAPESPQAQTVPLFASSNMAGYTSSRASSATFSAQHMKVPEQGMSGAMPARSDFSFSSKYALSPDPAAWDETMLDEPDDELHRPDPRRDRKSDSAGSVFTMRGLMNLGCLLIVILGLISLFAIYPMVSYLITKSPTTLGGYNLGGINASGQVPELGNFGLIDRDTPESAYYHTSFNDGSEWELVFSDEFNTDGRTFYPGDDPYWEASDLHYWGTNNLEWYSPDMVNTGGGHLNITLARQKWRGLDYKGGMLTSWNKFCFTGGSHPGPRRKSGQTDGKGQTGGFVGRAAPEIDVIEATVDAGTLIGHVSQSGQWAPFNYAYEWFNTTDNFKLLSNHSELNTYVGGVYQQSTSGLSVTNQGCYTQGPGCFSVYGFEYTPGYDGYILWTNDNDPSWMIKAAGLAADPRVEIGPRPIPVEPMYMIFNLGISPNFGAIDWDHLDFPTWMLVDWVRVYQPKGSRNVGCDPEDYPTAEYINTFIEAYTNPNLTTWVDGYGQVDPKNRLVDGCT
ncbi:hypothetical protein RSAG8_10073, partial [Rhizoctonia solani AG-8 WAC10335]